jgi:hypothetical protein
MASQLLTKMQRNTEDFSASETASSLLILNNLLPKLCEIDKSMRIENKRLSWKFENLLAVSEENGLLTHRTEADRGQQTTVTEKTQYRGRSTQGTEGRKTDGCQSKTKTENWNRSNSCWAVCPSKQRRNTWDANRGFGKP